MATINGLNHNQEDLLVTATGGPANQAGPEENENDPDADDLETDDAAFDDAPMEDDDEDLDDDEVKRLFPGEDDFTANDDDDEPYEGIRHGDGEDEGLVDDNMSGMPVVPSPS